MNKCKFLFNLFAAWRRFIDTPLFVTALAAVVVLPITTAQGGIASAGASGSITLSGPTSGSTGAVGVPAYPGFLDTSSFAATIGTAQYMAETWPAFTTGGSGPIVSFIPTAPPSFTPTFLSESAGLGFTSTLVGDVDTHYVLDGGGLAPSVVSLSYPYIWAAGPASLVTFDVLITFADAGGVFGSADDLHFHIAKTGSASGDIATAGPISLPALPSADTGFDVHATFTLTAFSAPGDGATLIKTFGIPEPGTGVLAAVGLAGIVAWGWRRKR